MVDSAAPSRLAPLLAILSAVLFGASTPFAKLLLGAGIDGMMLAGLLYLGSGAGLFLLYLARRGMRPAGGGEASLTRADLPWLAFVVLIGGAIGPLLLMIGLGSTPASAASLLLNVESLATMAIAWIIFRENVDRRLLFGALAILAGALTLSWQGEVGRMGFGAVAIIGACLAWGVDNNLTRKLSAADPVQIAMIKGLGAGLVNFSLALARGGALPDTGQILLIGVVGFLGYGLSLVLFIRALRDLGSARTGAYFSTAPFIGAVLSVAIFGDTITPQLLVAAALMGLGVWLHLTERHEHEHVHEPMEHDHWHEHDAHHQHEHGPNDPPGPAHSHPHRHERLVHSHVHYPDLHHQHDH